ncbi:MAG TPA: DUF4349 domain-containing protein [Pyrinomonadaceae bacterium]|nr:DUF4349 domain-containing protein [Pyrinomonadaceae bacterium]
MRTLKLFLTIVATSILVACSGSYKDAENSGLSSAKPAAPADKQQVAPAGDLPSLQKVSENEPFGEMANRKIIKDADLTLEVDSPLDTQGRVTSIAEAHGGFVVTSESKQRPSDDPSQRVVDIALVIRVPSFQFGPTRDEILGLSKNVIDKKSTGQDVTEEFIDLEARIKTQVALEAQFMEIMKQAHKVEDALEVQRQIAEVRTQIEKLEGRKRFLENRSSLSTITVNLKAPTTILVTPTGFALQIKEAFKESVSIAREIILFLIRFLIVMIPIFLFILLPIGLVARFLIRRARRLRPLAPPTPAPAPQA